MRRIVTRGMPVSPSTDFVQLPRRLRRCRQKRATLDALGYVERVLRSRWHEQFRHDEIAGPDPRERPCRVPRCTRLEELVETPGPHIDPYEAFLMQNLVEVRELLRNRQPLRCIGSWQQTPDEPNRAETTRQDSNRSTTVFSGEAVSQTSRSCSSA